MRLQLVCGLRSKPTKHKLLQEEALMLERAVEVVVSMESAQKHAQVLKGSPGSRVRQGKLPRSLHRPTRERKTVPPLWKA